MADTRDQIATLRGLLPEIEGGEGRLQDETLGRLICALHGVPISAYWTQNGSFWVETSDRKLFCDGLVWRSFTNHRPDTDLTAADDLVRKVLPGWMRQSVRYSDGSAIASMSGSPHKQKFNGEHPTSEPRAIIAALVRARIAELEAKQ